MGQRGGYSFVPALLPRHLIPNNQMVADYCTIWDESKFLVPREPIEIGTVGKDFSAVTSGISCHSMPIKMPGTDFRIPLELEQFLPAIEMCANFEGAVDPQMMEKSFAYLGIDQSYVEVGKRQRSAEKHTDGIQGPRIQPKIEIEHTYLCVDRDPPKVYVQEFFLGNAKADTHFLTPYFEKQADESKALQLRPYVISLLDAYTVHGSVVAEESGIRTLMKLSFSTRLFDRKGNSHNLLFDYNWEMHPRPIPTNLIGYEPRKE
ncbi:MAG TPA: hypothetical protein PKD37_04415 [Oligoflexia bacterium]|nr:hypothetical protein [Oligoflexia bacterium]HMP27209.1 hypothetical protein [Oligoflexia bacterium]